MIRITINLLLVFLFASCSIRESVQVKEIKNINLTGFESDNLLVQAEIEIDNKYILPVKLESAQLNILSNNDSIGTIEIEKPVKIKARKQAIYTFDFRIRTNQGMKFLSVMQNFLNNKSNFKISGTFNAHAFIINRKIPVNEALFGK